MQLFLLCGPCSVLGQSLLKATRVAKCPLWSAVWPWQVDDKQACELAVSCRASLPVDHVMSTLEECETRWKHEQLGQKIMSGRPISIAAIGATI